MTSMAITRTEFLNDRVRVHYCLKRPRGEPDKNGVVEVLFDSIFTLPLAPTIGGSGQDDRDETWEELVSVPACNVILSLQFQEWQETNSCRMQALVGGPFKKA